MPKIWQPLSQWLFTSLTYLICLIYPFWYCLLRLRLLRLGLVITNRGLTGIGYQWIDYQCTIMAWGTFLPIMIGTNWWKQILNFTIAKHGQNIGNKSNAMLTIGKSLVERNTWKSWPAKMFKCIGKRLAVICNQYFTNHY